MILPDKRSAIEDEPAIFIAQPLVIQHKLADFRGKLRTLPLALHPTRFHTFIFSRRCARRPDRVSCCAQFVRRHMRDRRRLSGSVSRFPCCAAQRSGSAHGVSASGTGLHHRHFTAHPGVSLLNRAARTVVARLCLLEVGQDMLRAIRCPYRQQAMIGVR